MKYRVAFMPSAEREFLRLPFRERTRIGCRVETLADNPRPVGCVKLSGGTGFWRIRVGDYRVIYTIEDKQLVVAVMEVAHRREVYRGL